MIRLDRHIQEATEFAVPRSRQPVSQLCLGLFPLFTESVGFYQVCHLTDAVSQALSHQQRMYYWEEFNLWYTSINDYLHTRHIPLSLLAFLTDQTWDDHPPQAGHFWFPSMREVVFLTFIAEARGYPVWTADRLEAFYSPMIPQRRTGRRR